MGRIVFLVVVMGAVVGCGAKVIQPSGPRMATKAETVKLYDEEPKEYEDLGEISVAGELKYGEGFSLCGEGVGVR